MKFFIFKQPHKHRDYKQTLKVARTFAKYCDNDVMYCPYCGYPLLYTNKNEKLCDDYEDIMCEEPSYKPIYMCSNTNCHPGHFAKFIPSGDMYENISDEIKNEQCLKLIRATLYNPKYFQKWPALAINSNAYVSSLETYKPHLKKEIIFKLFKKQKYVPTIRFNYKFDKFDKCKYRKLHFELRKYVDENSYIIITRIMERFKARLLNKKVGN